MDESTMSLLAEAQEASLGDVRATCVLRSEHLTESQPLLALILNPWNVFEGCEAQPNTSSESEQGMRTEHMLQEANHLLQFKRPSHIQRKKCLPQW